MDDQLQVCSSSVCLPDNYNKMDLPPVEGPVIVNTTIILIDIFEVFINIFIIRQSSLWSPKKAWTGMNLSPVWPRHCQHHNNPHWYFWGFLSTYNHHYDHPVDCNRYFCRFNATTFLSLFHKTILKLSLSLYQMSKQLCWRFTRRRSPSTSVFTWNSCGRITGLSLTMGRIGILDVLELTNGSVKNLLFWRPGKWKNMQIVQIYLCIFSSFNY